MKHSFFKIVKGPFAANLTISKCEAKFLKSDLTNWIFWIIYVKIDFPFLSFVLGNFLRKSKLNPSDYPLIVPPFKILPKDKI